MPCKIFPKLTDESLRDIGSPAEAKFYKACRDKLPSNCLVLHSVSLIFEASKNGQHAVGESDFVIFNPDSGILIVEVKGGGIRYNPDQDPNWYSVDRNGAQHKIKDPFEQSKNYQFRILSLIQKTLRSLKNSHFPLGHSVAFPDISSKDLGKIISHNRPREIIACADDLNHLDEWYKKTSQFWSGKGSVNALGSLAIAEIEKLFLKPVFARPSTLVQIEDEEAERIRLTDDQMRLLMFLQYQNKVNISGGAGTGKTVLAKKMVEQFSQGGNRVAFLCYNRALGQLIESAFIDTETIIAGSYHSVFMRLIRNSLDEHLDEARDAYPGADEWRVSMPLAFTMALEDSDFEGFDAVVVDEAQDFSPEMWLPIEILLKTDESKFFVFSDTHQGLYHKTENIPKLSQPFLLTTNCRNTRQIHESAYAKYQGPPVEPPKLDGESVVVLKNKTLAGQIELIIEILDELILVGGLNSQDIVILVANSPDLRGHLKFLRRAKSRHSFIQSEIHVGSEIRVSSIKKFKGLEAQILIVWGLSDVSEHDRQELEYVGLSRAKSRCYVVNN